MNGIAIKTGREGCIPIGVIMWKQAPGRVFYSFSAWQCAAFRRKKLRLALRPTKKSVERKEWTPGYYCTGIYYTRMPGHFSFDNTLLPWRKALYFSLKHLRKQHRRVLFVTYHNSCSNIMWSTRITRCRRKVEIKAYFTWEICYDELSRDQRLSQASDSNRRFLNVFNLNQPRRQRSFEKGTPFSFNLNLLWPLGIFY